MRLVFMGTPDFALPTLEALIQAQDHEVACVVTQPDKPKGRGRQLQMPPVKEKAVEKGIPVLQPQRLQGNTEIIEALKNFRIDAAVVVAYGKIIPDALLEIPGFGFINVHASLLPRFRGAAPINRAILAGCTVTGVSIMQIDSGLDTGPVFMKSEIPIPDQEDAVSLSAKLSELGAKMLLKALALIGEGRIQAVPQRHEDATYAPMLKKEEGEIDWGADVGTVHNMVRGLLPWPCAYTYLDGRVLRIIKAAYSYEAHGLAFGTMRKDGRGIRIACSGGFIMPELVQMEGKKVIDSRAFSNGLRSEELVLGRKAR